ncbi:MAG: 16S rRNA processing protein RimM [Candidatus Parcubacteria bacterium]|nr:16S rRNA processing protein RimM [Burkholderiales bacterium]
MIEFGRVAEPYGVRGWLRVVVDDPELLAAAPVWWIDGEARTVRESKPHSGTLLARLEGIETPEQARTLKGRAVSIPRPEAGEGRYYWSDLVGLEVRNEQGVVLGVVKQMSSNGAHDVMEVSAMEAAGEKLRLLPFVPAYVKQVDLPNRRIEVEWQVDW